MTDDRKNRQEMSTPSERAPSEKKIEQLLHELQPVELPPFYTERLQAKVRAAATGSPWARRLRSPQLAWAVAGACVAALVLIVVNSNNGGFVPAPIAPDVSIAQASIDPVMPADNSVVGANDVEIVAAIYPPVEQGIVRLYIDEMDVTDLAEVTGSYVMYSPPEKFAEGEHIITIEIQDGSGTKLKDVSWLFYTLNGERHALDEQV